MKKLNTNRVLSKTSKSAEKIHLFEVGLRDGLQNEKQVVSFANKVELMRGLLSSGVKNWEIGSYVRPDRVPQMADTEKLFLNSGVDFQGTSPLILVPNQKGFEKALATNVKAIAVFTSTSETFNQKNIGMGLKETLTEFREIILAAKKKKIWVRGYISTVWGCPYEGKKTFQDSKSTIASFLKWGVDQISLGDTIGVARPWEITSYFSKLFAQFPKLKKSAQIAGHFHDTRGTALANAWAAIHAGVRWIDASAGGLGGCPFAPGATGNLATEDFLYSLQGSPYANPVDLEKLCQVSAAFHRAIQKKPDSRYLNAWIAKRGSLAGTAPENHDTKGCC